MEFRKKDNKQDVEGKHNLISIIYISVPNVFNLIF